MEMAPCCDLQTFREMAQCCNLPTFREMTLCCDLPTFREMALCCDESRQNITRQVAPKTFCLALEYILPHVLMVTRRANILFGCI